LPNDWQGMGSVDHRFALNNPALMSAPSKKSFSSASCPIFAWRTLRSGVSDVGFVPPNTSAARASNCCFHSVIWVGWTLKVARPIRPASCLLRKANQDCLVIRVHLIQQAATVHIDMSEVQPINRNLA
jgi:hypothetical protein